MEDIPNASGIYKITCTANEKIYIGSAVNLRDRRRCHFKELRRNAHGNPKLQNAFNKYGEETFIFEVLELVLPMSLTAREQYWFNKLKPFGNKGFNIAREAGSCMGVKHSPEVRAKLIGNKNCLGRECLPETRARISQAQIGKKVSPETREKLRQASLAREPSHQAIEAMRQSNLGRRNPPEAIEKTRQANLGSKKSPETIEKIRQSKLGKKHSPEHIEKLRQASIGRRKSPEEIEKIRQTKLARKIGA